MVDANKDQLLWMGSGTGAVSDKSIQEENATAAINKILAEFPQK